MTSEKRERLLQAKSSIAYFAADYDGPHEELSHKELRELLQASEELEKAQRRLAYISLHECIEALAEALYVAGIRSDTKDGRPRLIAEGVYANLRMVQRLDLCHVVPAGTHGTRTGAETAAREGGGRE